MKPWLSTCFKSHAVKIKVMENQQLKALSSVEIRRRRSKDGMVEVNLGVTRVRALNTNNVKHVGLCAGQTNGTRRRRRRCTKRRAFNSITDDPLE